MDSSTLSALNAYRNQMKMMQGAEDGAGAEETGGASFSQLMNDALKEAAGAQYNADAMQMQSVTGGKVDLADLVTAVSNAELALNTVVAVRDRVINAYQDILRMTI